MRAEAADGEDERRRLRLRVEELEKEKAELEKQLADANWQIDFLTKSLSAKQQEMDMAVQVSEWRRKRLKRAGSVPASSHCAYACIHALGQALRRGLPRGS